MEWLAIAIMYVATLGFAGYLVWLFRFTKSPKEEIEQVKKDMASLALTVGLRKSAQPGHGFPFGPPNVG